MVRTHSTALCTPYNSVRHLPHGDETLVSPRNNDVGNNGHSHRHSTCIGAYVGVFSKRRKSRNNDRLVFSCKECPAFQGRRAFMHVYASYEEQRQQDADKVDGRLYATELAIASDA